MNINRIYFPGQSAVQSNWRANETIETNETREVGSNGGASAFDQQPKDQLNISSRGSFQNKLDAEMRRYSKVNQGAEQAMPQKVDRLKEEYANDACPISSCELARAIMNSPILPGGML